MHVNRDTINEVKLQSELRQHPWARPALDYVKVQEELLGEADLRGAEMPNPPYPAVDNPMLAYLLKRAAIIAEEEEGPQAAMVWLAAHAWFEGGLDARAQLVASS